MGRRCFGYRPDWVGSHCGNKAEEAQVSVAIADTPIVTTPISSSSLSSKKQPLRKSNRLEQMRGLPGHSRITCRVTLSRILPLRPQHLLDLLPSTGSWVVLHNPHRASHSLRLLRIVIHSVQTTSTQLGRVSRNHAFRALSTLWTKTTILILRHMPYLPSPSALTAHRTMGHRTHLCRLWVRRIRSSRPWVCLLSPAPCLASIMHQTSSLQSWRGRPLFPVNKATFLLADMEPRPMLLVCLVSILLTGSQVTPVMFPQWHHWVIDQEP